MQKMLSYVRRAVDHYHMIDEGDRIAVGVSGGKDSLALLVALSQLSRFYPHRFTVVAITLEMGYDEMDFSPVQTLCDKLGVRVHPRPHPDRPYRVVSATRKIPARSVPSCAAALCTMPPARQAAARLRSAITLTM